MGMYPTKAAGNIYCQCRKAASLNDVRLRSREGAAELLGYSVSAVSGWELGSDRPSSEAVSAMANLYHAPELRNYYCRSCPLGVNVPEIQTYEIDRIAVMVLYVINKLYQSKDCFLEIIADGNITDADKPILAKIIKNLDEMTQLTINLKYWAEKNM